MAKLTDLIEQPESQQSMLLRSIIGPPPSLKKYIPQASMIRSNLLHNPRTLSIRKYLSTINLANTPFKQLYLEHLAIPELQDDFKQQLSIISSIKQSKRRETALKSLRSAHPTQKWLHDKKFPKGQPNQNQTQSQQHIFNRCSLTKSLRDHVNMSYDITGDLAQIQSPKQEIRALYKKIAKSMNLSPHAVRMRYSSSKEKIYTNEAKRMGPMKHEHFKEIIKLANYAYKEAKNNGSICVLRT